MRGAAAKSLSGRLPSALRRPERKRGERRDPGLAGGGVGRQRRRSLSQRGLRRKPLMRGWRSQSTAERLTMAISRGAPRISRQGGGGGEPVSKAAEPQGRAVARQQARPSCGHPSSTGAPRPHLGERPTETHAPRPRRLPERSLARSPTPARETLASCCVRSVPEQQPAPSPASQRRPRRAGIRATPGTRARRCKPSACAPGVAGAPPGPCTRLLLPHPKASSGPPCPCSGASLSLAAVLLLGRAREHQVLEVAEIAQDDSFK